MVTSITLNGPHFDFYLLLLDSQLLEYTDLVVHGSLSAVKLRSLRM